LCALGVTDAEIVELLAQEPATKPPPAAEPSRQKLRYRVRNTSRMQDAIHTTGAVVVGWNAFAMAPDRSTATFEVQVLNFVATRTPPSAKATQQFGFTFVTDGLVPAVQQAKVAARRKDCLSQWRRSRFGWSGRAYRRFRPGEPVGTPSCPIAYPRRPRSVSARRPRRHALMQLTTTWGRGIISPGIGIVPGGAR
jgi:hypothetical protein